MLENCQNTPGRDRINILNQAREETLLTFSCSSSQSLSSPATVSVTEELIDLIDREMDLISRRRCKDSMEGLRKRLQNLFLQLVRCPVFNPACAQLSKKTCNAEK
uniref:IQ motif and ubiquitin-like domain-containing protein n=1 Tax=Corethron hystrix TaxID=216773 RepID=A0A7S1BCA1_9STRA|mmetsp:Transcript_20725/g.47028  ORF Transcript_20725/g.47028 Transcript_20725/m.47028 type:complete len:105 (+) Transcript_20725:906-1220(+)